MPRRLLAVSLAQTRNLTDTVRPARCPPASPPEFLVHDSHKAGDPSTTSVQLARACTGARCHENRW